MPKRETPWKIYPTAEQKAAITAGQTAARYSTRSAYIIDCVLEEPSADLSRIAAQVGRLGLLANEILGEDESYNRRLAGRRADKAVRKIIEACDAITDRLREE
ncbi:hypothetical protein [Thalassorhabdomicrobium marinisediminis]|uniref:Mobilization protein n=1 Tax=Thalassorhabdomicrobium marinisediminis TaxID=2170577 RepID=A0A2T7FSV3_9RHOB|nr:hypothetical protein [Thalassorhabdomicrobium marinisediminis]PVA05249.1 hypothetical protein DC363_16255 [Thalassorhabdomicrobium marinisediminis]